MEPRIKEYKSAKVFDPVGKCIYCGSTSDELTDEHIVPFALNGNWILPKSSCKNCASITGKFEMDVLRGPFSDVRTTLNLRTRNKKKRPSHLSLKIKRKGHEEWEVIQLTPEENYTTATFLEFAPPAYLDGRAYEKGILVTAISIIYIGGNIEELIRKYNIESIEGTVTYNAGSSFERLLAKIAYGFTVAHLGVDNFEESFLQKIILGEEDTAGKYVGGCPDKIMRVPGTIHAINITVTDKREIIVRLKLFSYADTPEYIVVVGRLNEKAYNLFLSSAKTSSNVDCNK